MSVVGLGDDLPGALVSQGGHDMPVRLGDPEMQLSVVGCCYKRVTSRKRA